MPKVNNKQWKILPKVNDEIISQFPELNSKILQLLYNRNLKTQEQIDEFFNADYLEDIHDPYLLSDMKKAVERIFLALENKEKVLVYGDYDADGVTSSALLVDILKFIGISAEVRIPHRETEGYGLNLNAVNEIIKADYKLIITCDCGITNYKEVDEFNKNKVDVIITDHHQEPEKLPPAFAIIHAGLKREIYPAKNLAGVGIAYKLACGILKSDLCKISLEEKDKKAKWLLDLVALGTVTDMVPLTGENRTLVKYGLKTLQKTRRLGLQQLYIISGTKVEKMSSYTIGFQLGPRLNAAGRMDHANTAFELLKTDNLEKAIEISKELNLSNTKRQDVTKKTLAQAKSQIDYVNDDVKVIWVENKDWNLGIVGLVAGKLAQEYYRPSFVFGYDNEKWVCSCRGIDEIDLIEVIRSVSDKLLRFGGHKSAAGLSVSENNLPKIKKLIRNFLEEKLKDVKLIPSLIIDAELDLADVDWNMWNYLEKFEPFGMNNKKPNFISKSCLVKNIQYLGSGQTHLKIDIEQKGVLKKAIGFSMVKKFPNLQVGDLIDLVFNIDLNEWNGRRSLEMYISDLKIKDKK